MPVMPSFFFFARDSNSKWNGVQAAPSWNCGIWDGLNGWSAEPCFQRLHTGKKKKICACLSKQSHWKHLENKQNRKDWNSKILGKGKTNRREHCSKKHISLWLLFGWMLPDLRWHSLSPLTPEVSEAGNRISPQAKHRPDFFNDATINPWNAQPSKNSKATMQRQIVHIYFTHLVMFTDNYHSGDWNWGQWSG